LTYDLPSPSRPFYDPENDFQSNPAVPSPYFLGQTNIEGPSNLCVGQIGHYTLLPNFTASILSEIEWSGSVNIEIHTPTQQETDATLNIPATPSYLEVSFSETRQIPQYTNGNPLVVPVYEDVPGVGNVIVGSYTEKVDDKCQFLYRKPIISELPPYQIETDFKFCTGSYSANAVGPGITGAIFTWTFKDINNGATITATGKNPTVHCPFSLSNFSVLTTLKVVLPGCGSYTISDLKSNQSCSDLQGGAVARLIVYPNPALDEITLLVDNPTEGFFNEGIMAHVYQTNTGVLVRTQNIYVNSAKIPLLGIEDGNYHIQVSSSQGQNLSTSFIIQH
jgi:hypothetical protein